MQVTREQVAPCTVALNIQVEPDVVNRAFDRAFREFGNFTNVPGFRPGKAPRPILERYVSHDRLRERVVEIVAAPAYREALKQEDITPYRDPAVEFKDLAEGQPFEFRATVPTEPQVTLGDYEGIRVDRPVYGTRAEDVESEIEDLRSEYARLQPVEDRGIEPGDTVVADMAITLEGQEKSEPRATLIRTGNNIPGFDEAVLGQTTGEQRSFTLTYPPDFQDAETAGKVATFDVSVRSINQRVLPELTDEWVREVTPYQSVEELRSAVAERLDANLRALGDRVTESRIIEELVKRSQISYPGVMVEEEIEDEQHQLEEELAQRHLTMEQYLTATGQTPEQLREEQAQRADERVKSVLVLRELARREGLEVTTADVDAEIDALMDRHEVAEAEADRLKQEGRRRAQVANVLIKRKLRERLFELATVTDVPARPEQA